MAFCRNCGSALPEGKKFCPECGEPAGEAPVRASAPAPEYPVRQAISAEYPAQKPRRKRKSLFRRWWFWLLVLAIAATLWNRAGGSSGRGSGTKPTAPVVTATPRSTPRPTAKPAEKTEEPAAPEESEPEESPEPEPQETPLSSSDIRPEFKEFMDSYEDYMDEYIEFMEKYEKADPAGAALMLYDYSRLMERYADFAEKLNAMDESDYTAAEWAYYLEVTNRVNRKLLDSLG